MTERKPREISFASWIDQRIAEAAEQGAFDDLPGAGKPIPRRSGGTEAWLQDYLRREGVSADELLPVPLRLRKEALLIQMEEVLAEAMYELWPDESRRPALRLAAMMAMGTLRFAKDNWRRHDAARPLTHYIDEAFDLLGAVGSTQTVARRGQSTTKARSG